MIIEIVRLVRSTANATEAEIKKTIMTWIQHSGDRIKARLKAVSRKR
ncbi:unnamed protein product, partial [Allacma fusca]